VRTILGWTASSLSGHGHGKFEEVDVEPKPGEKMDVFSQHAVQWFPEAIVSEPGIGHEEQGELAGMVDGPKHLSGLIQLGPKIDLLFAQTNLPFLERFLGAIDSEVQRESSPAALDGCEQPDGDDVLSPRVTELILFGGMIEETVEGEDLLADLGVDAVIEGQKDRSLIEGVGDGFSEGFQGAVPREWQDLFPERPGLYFVEGRNTLWRKVDVVVEDGFLRRLCSGQGEVSLEIFMEIYKVYNAS